MENESSSSQQLQAAPLLQENNVTGTGGNNNQHDESFPSYLCCPITQQPASRGVTFNVPEQNSLSTHPQVLNIQQCTDTLQLRELTLSKNISCMVLLKSQYGVMLHSHL